MSDRLEEIKTDFRYDADEPELIDRIDFDNLCNLQTGYVQDSIAWLIAEVERLRTRNGHLKSELEAAVTRPVGGWPE